MKFNALIGVGGIGTGMFFTLDGDRTLGRDESRLGRLLDCRDYCKLHIISHFAGMVLGAHPSGSPFHVIPIGKVGNDEAGMRLRKEMDAIGMDTRFVDAVDGRPTMLSVCFQYPDGSGGNITTSNAAPGVMTVADVDRAKRFFIDYGDNAIVLAAPEVSLEIRKHLLSMATRHGAFRAASFASAEMAGARRLKMFDRIDLLSINEDEAATMSGVPYDHRKPQKMLEACASALTAANRRMQIVVSAGRWGAYGFDGSRWDHSPAIPVEVVSTAGAGDALFGGVLAGLAAGLPLAARQPGTSRSARRVSSALDLGILMATMNTTSPHTIHPGENKKTLLKFAAKLGITIDKPVRDLLR